MRTGAHCMSLSPELQETLIECRESTESFCQILMPKLFTRPFSPKLGRIICDAIDDDSHKHTLILAPRGIGKSTIVQAACIRRALFKKSSYIVNVSASGTMAEQQSENIKDMLLTNDAIKELWGDQQSNEWAIERWTMKNKCHFFPRGYGQQLHGMNHRGNRPDLFIIDDVEDPFHMDSDDYRAKVSRWFWQSLYGCLDQSRDDWRIVIIGTMSHQDCILARIMKDEKQLAAEGKPPAWNVVHLALCDEAFNSTDENYMGTEAVKAMADKFRRAGELDSFYRQYMNIPIADENKIFRDEHFKYYDEHDLPKTLEHFVIMDPAKTAKLTSADTAIVGVSFDYSSGYYYIRDIVHGKMHPDEMHARAIEMAMRLKAWGIGVEITGLNEHVTSPLKNEIIRRTGGKLKVIELHARGKKEDRIKHSLGALYRQGLVFHNKANSAVLENQLRFFPNSDLIDVADAVSYISEIIEKGDRYFDPKETAEEIAKDYEDLNSEWEGRPVKRDEFGDGWLDAEQEAVGW